MNIPAGQMNFLEKCITAFLRVLRVFKKGESKTKEVFLDVTKTIDGQKVLYMRRWFLWETAKGNLYLHRIVRSDDEDCHNHPWPFTSLILWQGYFDFAYEIVQGAKSKYLECTIEKTRPFHIYHRPVTHLHKVILNKPSWSLVWVGKYDKVNEWGFVLSDGTFVPYRKYLNLPDDAPVAVYDRIEKQ